MGRLVTVVAVLLVAAPGPARAQDRVRFSWSAPDGACPPASQLVAETEQALGPAEGPTTTPLSVDAIVTRRSHGRLGITLVMHFPSGDATREIAATDCASLVHAAALVVALAMQPETPLEPMDAGVPSPGSDLDGGVDAAMPLDAGTEPPVDGSAVVTPPVDGATALPSDGGSVVSPPPDGGTTRLDASTPTARTPPPRVAPPAAVRSRLALELVALGLLDPGTLPNAAPGIAVGAGFRYDDFHLEALFVDLPGGDGTVPGHPSQGGHFGLVAGRLAAALDLLHADVFTLAPAVAFEVGDLSGHGFGVSSPGAGDFVYALIALGARATLTFGPVTLRLDVEGFAPLIRRQFTLDGVGTIYTPWPVDLRIGLGVGIHFP